MVTGDSKWFNAMDGEQALPSVIPTAIRVKWGG
jgi:hypothetical protein